MTSHSKQEATDLSTDSGETLELLSFIRYGSLMFSGVTPTELPVPESVKESLDRYAKNRIPTGGFLCAVLENNLREAVGRADLLNQAALCAIVSYIYNNLPAGCWGSPEKVQAWLAGRIAR